MTSAAVDYRQPIGETRNLDIINPISIMEKALESLSLVACEIATTKPKDDVVIDIDEFDKNNELAVVEYVEEIYMDYKLRETEACFRDYMDSQPDISDRKRAALIDWLIHLHSICDLMPETFYLTINIVDRYLSVTTIAITELQLVGIAALFISSKYEEIWPYANIQPIWRCGYSKQEIFTMEMAILSRLDWYLSVPTPYVFTVRYTKASLPSDKETEDMVFFYTEIGLLDYKVTARNNPSKLAASAVYAARCTLKKTPVWTETLKHYTGYSEDQLRDCAKRLVSLHACASENKRKEVYEKYANPDRSAVSLFPPATSL